MVKPKLRGGTEKHIPLCNLDLKTTINYNNNTIKSTPTQIPLVAALLPSLIIK